MSGPTSDRIVGSLVSGGLIRPFVFDRQSDRLLLDVYEPQAEVYHLPPEEISRLADHLRTHLDMPVRELRFGEYYCPACGRWFAATRTEWSVAMCLYCSLDRGTELGDRFRER